MPEHPLRRVVRPLGTTESDVDLLDRWVSARDQSAFELLVWRYGAMVLATCRRFLPLPDAEDAFQAVFLVLVRKAGSVGRRGSLGGWLHRVAVRVSRAARMRVNRSSPLALEPIAPEVTDTETRELRAVLDEELDRLPERFRRVLVLCYLQGKTADEAARELGCPRGTILSRLLRGRERLRVRLVRRGVAPSAAALLANLERAGAAVVPPRLVESAVSVGVAPVAATGTATELAKGALQAMWWNTMKVSVAAVLVTAAVGVTAGLTWRSAVAGDPDPKAAKPADDPKKEAEEKIKKEMAKLKGKWKAVAVEIAGEALAVDAAKANVWEIADGKIKTMQANSKEGAEVVAEVSFKIDPTQTPAHIDAEGDVEGTKTIVKGIYKLDGDELTVCLYGADGGRPSEFSSSDLRGGQKGGNFLFKFKREKP